MFMVDNMYMTDNPYMMDNVYMIDNTNIVDSLCMVNIQKIFGYLNLLLDTSGNTIWTW